jgi:outer membrane protein, heavy metal efflux system
MRRYHLIPCLLLLAPLVLSGAEQPTLSLDDAVTQTLHRSLVIASARAGVAGAQAQEVTAGYRPNPSLNLGAEQFDLIKPNSYLGSDSGAGANRTYTVHVDQQIELGGKRGLRLRTAAAQRRAAEAQVDEARRQQIAAVRQIFVAGLLARDNLRLAEDNVSLDDRTEGVIRTQVDAGHRPQADLISFTVGRIQARQEASAARLAYDQIRTDLLNVLGSEPGTAVPELIGDLEAPTALSPAVDDATALAQRSDVIVARLLADAADAAVDLARSQRAIDPTLGIEYQRVGGTNTAGVTATIPLPMWNNHAGDINQADAARIQAELQWRLIMRQARAEVEKAHQGVLASRAQLNLYSPEMMAKASQVLEIVSHSYQEGATSLLELMDARRAHNQVHLAANQVRYAHRLAAIQLDLALGTPAP